MNSAFLAVLNMSITGAFVISAIALVRPLLRNAPKGISYALWSVAGFRLLFPIQVKGLFSLIPFNPSPIPHDIATQPLPRIDSGIGFVDRGVSKVLPVPAAGASANPLQIWLLIGTYIWLLGLIFMLGHSILSFFALRRRLAEAQPCSDGVYELRNLGTPFVFGFLYPRIYIPVGLQGEERRYIVLHEQTHIRRRDHIIKMLAHFVLCLHWFNPFAWIAFVLMCADMEMSCDEQVVLELGADIKEAYSLSLVRMATARTVLGGCPLAFGEGGMKERVRHVLGFRRSSHLVVAVSLALVAVLAVGFAVSRRSAGTAGVLGNGEISPGNGLPELTFGTPRNRYTPLMSSMFGFRLDMDEPGAAKYSYECDGGTFCTYEDGHITRLLPKVTTTEIVYWWPFRSEDDDFYEDIVGMGDTYISVTALDENGTPISRGVALVIEDDGWFQFISGTEAQTWISEYGIGGYALEEADDHFPDGSAQVGDPVQVVRLELESQGREVLDVHLCGANFIEHSTLGRPAQDFEVASVYAEYVDEDEEIWCMNYTLRRPVGDDLAQWVHGDPIPYTDHGVFGPIPQIPTGEPYASASIAARRYLAGLGYEEGSIVALHSTIADYSGADPDLIAKMKDETVTLGVDLADDPKSHPQRTITLTREDGGQWEVIHTLTLPPR